MKSFHSFITEKKRNPGRPGDQDPLKLKELKQREILLNRMPILVDLVVLALDLEVLAAD